MGSYHVVVLPIQQELSINTKFQDAKNVTVKKVQSKTASRRDEATAAHVQYNLINKN